jgi:hypothetical protein
MGKEQLLALAEIIRQQVEAGPGSPITGTWTIEYDKTKRAFYFGKCEFGGYCEERPALIGVSGEVLDKGGPLLGG